MVRRPTSPSQIETANNIPAPLPAEDVLTDPYAAAPGTAPPVVRTVLGTLPAPSDLTQKELEAFDLMNDPLREKALKIRDQMANETRGILESRYALGGEIIEIHEHPEIYGHMSDMHLAGFFGDGGRTVYAEARRIRERYSPQEFQNLLAAYNPKTGGRVHYRHLTTLLAIEDKATADKTLELRLAQNWTTRQLERHIRTSTRGGDKLCKGGRRITRPASLMGFVERVRGESDEYVHTFKKEYESGAAMLKAFAALPEEKKTADLLRQVQKAQAAVLKAGEANLKLAEGFKEMEQDIAACLRQRRGARAQPTTPKNNGVEANGEPDEAHEGE